MKVLKINELIKKEPITISNHETILDATMKLRDESVGLLVVTEGDKVVGVLSERDIIGAVASRINLNDKVENISTKNTISVTSHADAIDAAAIMHNNKIRHVIVIDDGHLKGVVSIRDLLGERELLRSLADSRESWL